MSVSDYRLWIFAYSHVVSWCYQPFEDLHMTDIPTFADGVCDWRSRFDRKIEYQFEQLSADAHDSIRIATGGRTPGQVRDCAIFVHDTLELAQTSAETIFGTKAVKPETVIGIYDRIMDRLATVDAAAEEARIKAEAQEYWESQADSAEAEKLSTAELMRKHANP